MSFLVDKLVAGERIIPLRIAAVAISHLYGLVSWEYYELREQRFLPCWDSWKNDDHCLPFLNTKLLKQGRDSMRLAREIFKSQ